MSREAQATAAIQVLESFLARPLAQLDRAEVVAHATLSALSHHWPNQHCTTQIMDLLHRSAQVRAQEPSRWMTQRRIAISKAAAQGYPIPF